MRRRQREAALNTRKQLNATDGPRLEALEPRLLLSDTPWLPGDANTDDVVDYRDLDVLTAPGLGCLPVPI